MRKLHLCIVLAAIVVAAASCGIDWLNYPPADKDQTEPPTPDPDPEPVVPEIDPADVSLKFNVAIPAPTSANDGDAGLADELHYALYSNDEGNISYVKNEESIPIVRDTVSVEDREAVIELGISGGSQGEYVIIIWSQNARAEGEEFYDLTDLRNIRCVGESSVCNSEERVAYYITHKFSVTSETYSEDLVLSRPHSRINLGTFAEALKRPDGATLRLDQSSVTIKGASASFNTIAGLETDGAEFFGKAGEAASEGYEFSINDIPEKTIVINGIEYPYLALNYMFVSGSVDMDFVIVGTPQKPAVEGTEPAEDSDEIRQAKFEGRLSGINARQDLTTTIIGYFFGADGRFEYDFRITIGGGSDSNGNVIIGDEDGDGLYDDEMDYGWSLGGDDSWTGGGIIGGGDEFVDPDLGGGDGSEGEEEQKEDVRIELPNAVTWEVYTREGLYMWAEEVRASTTSQRINLKLFEDIYLDEDELWIPVTVSHETNYYGSIDGQEHSIHNLTINSEGNNVGFLARTSQDDDIQVANLYFHNVHILGGNCTGVVVGTGRGIYNCHVMSGTVTGGDMVGAIVGCSNSFNGSPIRNCTNSADVSGTTHVGGIAGDKNLSIHCFVYDCTNYGNVTATGNYAGGICGTSTSLIPERCENHGEVRGNDYVGGIRGRGSVSDCKNSGSVYGNDYVGGITGYDSATECINRGNVTGVTYVGGISGYAGNFCTDSQNYGTVRGVASVGGCSGYAKSAYGATIESHFNYGDVYGESNVGGIFGRFSSSSKGASLVDSINEGDVSGNNNVGGLIGQVSSGKFNLSRNSTVGIITGSTNVDQFVGLLKSATINDDGTNVAGGEVVIVDAPAE